MQFAAAKIIFSTCLVGFCLHRLSYRSIKLLSPLESSSKLDVLRDRLILGRDIENHIGLRRPAFSPCPGAFDYKDVAANMSSGEDLCAIPVGTAPDGTWDFVHFQSLTTASITVCVVMTVLALLIAVPRVYVNRRRLLIADCQSLSQHVY